MISTKNVRNPRMNRRQKEELLRLVQMYFVRTTGSDVNVNERDIRTETWMQFTTLLNALGPPKTHEEWKTSFHYMKLRVKSKLDSTIKTFNQNGLPFNLDQFNEDDRKLILMFYMTSLSVENENVSETTNQFDNDVATIDSKEIVQLNVVQDSFEPNDQCKVQRDCNDFVQYEPLVNPTDHSKTIPDDMPIAFVKSSFVPSVSEYTEHINEQHETNFDTTSCTIRNEHSYTASLQSVDNLETMPSMRITTVTSLYGPDVSECTEFSNVPEHSESDSEIESQQNELIAEKEQSTRIDELARSSQVHRRATNSSVRRVGRHRGIGRLRGKGSFRGAVRVRGAGSVRGAVHIRGGGRARTGRLISGTAKLNGTKKRNPNQRISIIQKRRLLQLVECNFLRTVGRFSGFNGVIIKRRMWEDYAKELNSLGPPSRTGKGWEKAFTSIRLRAKSTFAAIRNERNKAGVATTILSEMDKQILAMFGIDQIDGHQELGEGGFPYSKTSPYRNESPLSQDPTPTDMDTDTIDYVNDPNALHERFNRLMNVPTSTATASSSVTHRKDTVDINGVINSARDFINGIEPGLGDVLMITTTEGHIHRQNASQNSGPSSTNNGKSGQNSSSTTDVNGNHNTTSTSNARTARTNVRRESSDNTNVETTNRSTNRARIESHDRNRDRDRYRNRYTSYEMVERSIAAQEGFIAQTDRNHNEMMYMFTSAVRELTSVFKDYLRQNNGN